MLLETFHLVVSYSHELYLAHFTDLVFSLGFWKKIDVFREQPVVHFEHELVLLLETDSGNIGWSTYHGYNELMQEQARVPTLKV